MCPLPYDHTDADDILRYAKHLVDNSLEDALGPAIAAHGIKGKGDFGQALERHYFFYDLNSEARADFSEAGLELKTAGVLPDGDGWKAKERLKLGSLNYHSILTESFDRSAFLEKNRRLLVVCHEYEKGKPVTKRVVRLVDIWDIPEEDLIQMEAEWNLIASYVRDGRAHELSEGLTDYLGAATSGQGKGRDFVTQPNSPQLAKKRALAFKQPYVNRIVKEFEARQTRERLEEASLVTNLQELERAGDIERLVLQRFEPFLGLTEAEAWDKLDPGIKRPSPNNKNRRQWLNAAILGVPGKRNIEEFDKAGIQMRSFPLQTRGRKPKEDFPFPAFDFHDLVGERWETSALRTNLLNRFLTVFYRRDDTGVYTLEDAVFWGFPEELLDAEARATWVHTVRSIRQGKVDELPKSSDTGLVFVRTHGLDSRDLVRLPNGLEVPKVSFWLHKDFLQGVFDDPGSYPMRASRL